MARGRHRRRSGLLSRLLPRRRRSRVALLQITVLEGELSRLRVLADATAATAAAALVRSAGAADAAAAAEQRAVRAEAELTSAREEVVALRADLAALREELVWAFAARRADVDADGRVSPAVIDLRESSSSTA
jgi:hypothetical protein